MLCQNRGKIKFWKIKGIENNLVIFDYHVVKKSQICSLNKLTSKELYLILVDANLLNQQHKVISIISSNHPSLTGKKIFFLIRNIT